MLKLKAGEKIPDPIIIETPSFGINYILGGGLKTGNIHIFWGTSQAGKTTISLHILAELQRQGYHAIIIDTEHSISEDWLQHCGVASEREVWRGNIVEEILKELTPLLKKGEKLAVLIDSINGVEWGSFYENVETSSGMAGGARARRLLWLKILEYTDPQNTIFLAVAQQTNDPNTRARMPVAKLGEADRHWSCNIVKLFSSDATDNVKRDKATERIVSKRVKWVIEKSKQAPVQGTTGFYWLDPITSQIDKKEELINIAVRNEIITQRGAWYYYGSERYHGLESLRASLTNEMMDDIEAVLLKTDLAFDVEEIDDGLQSHGEKTSES